jgi:hypothetical protein
MLKAACYDEMIPSSEEELSACKKSRYGQYSYMFVRTLPAMNFVIPRFHESA